MCVCLSVKRNLFILVLSVFVATWENIYCARLSACLALHQSACLAVCLSAGLSACLICLSLVCLYVCLSIPQHRVTKLSPRTFTEEQLAKMFEDSLTVYK